MNEMCPSTISNDYEQSWGSSRYPISLISNCFIFQSLGCWWTEQSMCLSLVSAFSTPSTCSKLLIQSAGNLVTEQTVTAFYLLCCTPLFTFMTHPMYKIYIINIIHLIIGTSAFLSLSAIALSIPGSSVVFVSRHRLTLLFLSSV